MNEPVGSPARNPEAGVNNEQVGSAASAHLHPVPIQSPELLERSQVNAM
jgi:hypothetical protein